MVPFNAMDFPAFDDMLDAIAANKDVGADGHAEAITTADAWSV